MGPFDKVNNELRTRQNAFKSEMDRRANERQEKSSMIHNFSTSDEGMIEVDYPVIVQREDGWFTAFTNGEYDIEEEGSTLEDCLEDMKEELESVLQEYVDENYEMPTIPTVQELESQEEVQQFLSEGMKIKVVKVKLDVSSIEKEEDDWDDDDSGEDW